MSSFKDAVQNDVKSVFINLDEFADIHDINGREVACIVDKDITSGKDNSFEGVFMNTITIYIDEKDIDSQPVEGEMLRLDREMYIVRSVSVEGGMFVIVAEANKQ